MRIARPSRIALATVAVTSCVSGRMALTPDIPAASEEIVITDRSRASGMFINEGFTMGPYRIVDVHHKVISASSVNIDFLGYSSTHWKSGYTFGMKLPDGGSYQGQCGIESHDRSGGFATEVHEGGLHCQCTGAGQSSLAWTRRNDATITTRAGSYGFTVTNRFDDGKTNIRGPTGYEVRGATPIGAVEVYDRGRIWLNRKLDAGERADLACMFVALLLYRPNK